MYFTGDSTTATDIFSDAATQRMANHYVTLMLRKITEDPYFSASGVLDVLERAGPLGSKNEILELFRGAGVSKHTITRMGIVRSAVCGGGAGSLLISTVAIPGKAAGRTAPQPGHYIKWWPPRATGYQPLSEVKMIRVWGGADCKKPSR